MAIQSVRRRRAIWERAGGACGICGQPVALAEMEVDHVVPQIDGGGDEDSNLRPAHATCNRSRGCGHDRFPGPKRYSLDGQAKAKIGMAVRLPYDLGVEVRAAALREGASLTVWFEGAARDKLEAGA